jgi:exopolyphosphatase/guanosine-5'-triphosphate,3'-diphosphate pyrophosphatase
MAEQPRRNVAAVIDIGSNTIKVLVAAGPGLEVLAEAAEDTRISTGIGEERMRLKPEAIAAGVESVRRLWNLALEHGPNLRDIIATSAVRDAENREEFPVPAEEATGLRPRTLSGDEEARLIGLGVAHDPNINSDKPFYLMDLGGGSLELLEFHGGIVRQKVSLQLGAVRLKEKLLADPGGYMSPDEIDSVEEYVAEAVMASGFSFRNPGALVATGGAMTHARFLAARNRGVSSGRSNAIVSFADMCELQAQLAGMPLAKRQEVSGLPRARADIMPVGLTVLTTIMELATAGSVVHSFYNLRYGLAAELLKRSEK